jgi:hypothetical protein
MENALEWFEEVCARLNEAHCDYMLAGGIATIFHGNPRLTMDLDCYISWEQGNAQRIMHVLEAMGYHLLQPITIEDLSDPLKRERYMREKGMLVATFKHEKYQARSVDLMFEQSCLSYETAASHKVDMGTSECALPTMGVDDLICMKKFAGRDKDLQDVSVLNGLLHEPL